MVYVASGRDVNGRELPLDDPAAARLRAEVASAAPGAAGLVDAMLSIDGIFDAELAANKVFRALLVDAVAGLRAV
jgi:fructuronate reductase